MPGGLDTVGIAAYKISTAFALDEIERIRRIGIEVRLDHPVDAGEIASLLQEYDAVFLGIGLGRTRTLGIPGEEAEGVWEALAFIFQTHEKPLADCVVGRNVVVIGGGNTAIDVATAAVRLGAGSVTIAYRRDEASMPAFAYEYALAKADGIRFEWQAQPLRVVVEEEKARGVEFVRTERDGGRRDAIRVVPGSSFVIPADMVVRALGQEPLLDLVAALPGSETRGRPDQGQPRDGRDEPAAAVRGGRLLAKWWRGGRRRARWENRGGGHGSDVRSHAEISSRKRLFSEQQVRFLSDK